MPHPVTARAMMMPLARWMKSPSRNPSFAQKEEIKMASASDRLVGSVLLLVALVVFTYYTVWAIIMPFVDADHPLHAYFLPRDYAVKIPAALLTLGVVVIFSFIAFVMLRSKAKKQKSS
jgi:dolichyl-phosphate mannosyltransferase polypeptide 2 regulatory subunit